LNQKLKAPVQRRTNWKASDLGKGNTAMKGADVNLSQEEVRNLGLRTARPTKRSDRCWAIKLDDAVLKRSSIT